jgi:hypothetical protein
MMFVRTCSTILRTHRFRENRSPLFRTARQLSAARGCQPGLSKSHKAFDFMRVSALLCGAPDRPAGHRKTRSIHLVARKPSPRRTRLAKDRDEFEAVS